MEKKSVYDFFIGLLALMLALMFVIDIFIDIPNEVSWTFYYIDNILWHCLSNLFFHFDHSQKRPY